MLKHSRWAVPSSGEAFGNPTRMEPENGSEDDLCWLETAEHQSFHMMFASADGILLRPSKTDWRRRYGVLCPCICLIEPAKSRPRWGFLLRRSRLSPGTQATAAFGGMAPTTVRAKQLEAVALSFTAARTVWCRVY